MRQQRIRMDQTGGSQAGGSTSQCASRSESDDGTPAQARSRSQGVKDKFYRIKGKHESGALAGPLAFGRFGQLAARGIFLPAAHVRARAHLAALGS